MRSMRSWFDAVLDQPAGQRQAWIDANCPDPATRERLRELLAVHDQTQPLLLDLPVEVPAALAQYLAGPP